MLLDDFKRIITAFADSPTDLDLSKGTLLVQVRDELIEAKLFQHGGQLIVEESEQRLPASTWVVNRIARVPLLADRVLSYVNDVQGFVTPSGQLLDQPNFAGASEGTAHSDAVSCAADVLGRRLAGTTSVLYLTSDAGEGKTTLINHLARRQALEFKAKRSDWLLVPIPLGGRTFLRFDDVVVAALVNRLRFQLLYYDAFIELVRLGVLVPAFDGFEEMIISSSSGEAISALGNLVRSLSSSGSVLIAARKAYFDYQSFKAQARLFDAIGTDSVAFARLSLDRWSRDQFLAYAHNRGFSNPESTYEAVADRLRPDHPLLTRAVLVRRLIDVASAASGLAALLDQIGNAPQDYFFQFVNALVEREAQEKWIDLSGEPHQPLLTTEEHHELLSMVAQEMWISSTDSLRADVLGAIAEMFAESKHKLPAVARQLSERLKQHSLLVSSGTAAGALSFDHEDFKAFYLGEAVGRILARHSGSELRSVLHTGLLSRSATDEALLHLRRVSGDVAASIAMLQELANTETAASLVRENCGALAIGLAEEVSSPLELANMSFPEDSLRGRSLTGAVVRDSYFQASSLAGTRLQSCRFENCYFERLEIFPDAQVSAVLSRCDISMLVRVDRDEQLFDPAQIQSCLSQIGFEVQVDSQNSLPLAQTEPDEELWLVERVMRIFLRGNQVNEHVIRTKLGVKASRFFDDVLPQLLGIRMLEEIPYLGHGSQRRFRLRVRMQELHDALAQCGGNFSRFLALVARG
jgi:hypothetical protein